MRLAADVALSRFGETEPHEGKVGKSDKAKGE